MLNKFNYRCQALNPQAERQLSQGEIPELFVPDGRLALLVQNGRPDRWFQPGRHQLGAGKAKLEVRLISGEILPDQGPDRLDQALDLPYERALLYLDGVQVAIVKPSQQPGRPIRKDAGGHQAIPSAPAAGRQASLPACKSDEEDLMQDFSFV